MSGPGLHARHEAEPLVQGDGAGLSAKTPRCTHSLPASSASTSALAVTSRPSPRPARMTDRPDRREVAQPIERGPPRDGDRLAVAANQVVREPRIAEGRHGLGGDRGAARLPDPEGVEQHPDDVVGGQLRRVGRRCRARRSMAVSASRAGPRGRPRARSSVRAIISRPLPMSSNPFASSLASRSAGSSCGGASHMCGWRPIEANRIPTSASRRSKAAGSLGQQIALEPVPERLRIERVVEQQRVAEVAQLPPGDRVDLRLVPEQATERGGVDRGRHAARHFRNRPDRAQRRRRGADADSARKLEDAMSRRLMPVLAIAITAALVPGRRAAASTAPTGAASSPAPAEATPAASTDAGAGGPRLHTLHGRRHGPGLDGAASPSRRRPSRPRSATSITWTNNDTLPAHGDAQGRPGVHDGDPRRRRDGRPDVQRRRHVRRSSARSTPT